MTRAAEQTSFAILASRLTLASSLAKTVTHTSAQRPDGSGVREFSPGVSLACVVCAVFPGGSRARSPALCAWRAPQGRAASPRLRHAARGAGFAFRLHRGKSAWPPPPAPPSSVRGFCFPDCLSIAKGTLYLQPVPCRPSRKDDDQEKGSASVPGKRTSPEIPGRLPRPPPAHACVLARRLAGRCRCPARPVRSGGGEPGGGARSVCHLASESSRS